MMGKDKFIGYSPEGNKMKLIYTHKTFNAYLQKDGHWHEILFKNIWKVNERVFNSVTVGDDGKIYLKVVNVSGRTKRWRPTSSTSTQEQGHADDALARGSHRHQRDQDEGGQDAQHQAHRHGIRA